MSTIVTRSGKGSPLTNTEVDANFTNLNTGKAELSGAVFTGAITTNSTIDGRDVAADGVTADAALPKAGGILTGTLQGTRVGIGVAAHSSAALNITTTDQHIRFNNGSELGIIDLDSDGELNIWAHGDGETINLKTGSGTGNNILSIAGSASTFSGTVTANAGVVVDNITIDGTTIALSSGDLTLDVAGDIILDADGGEVIFKDGGTTLGQIGSSAGLYIAGTTVGLRLHSGGTKIFPTNSTGGAVDGTVDLGGVGGAWKRLFLRDGVQDGGSAGSATVFNEDGTTADFRVESDGNDHMLFVDGGANKVGIGQSTPIATLDILATDPILRLDVSGGVANKSRYEIRGIGASGYEALQFRTANDANNTYTEMLSLAHGGAATFADDITLGGTAHRAWSAGYNTVQLDTSAMLYGNTSSISTASNLYYDSGWKHVATGATSINVNEAGNHVFYTGLSGSAGAAAVFVQRLLISPAGNININETGVDADFRVESDVNANSILVNGETGGISFGTTVTNMASNHNNVAGLGIANNGKVEMATTANVTALEVSKNEGTDGAVLYLRKQSTGFATHNVSSGNYLFGNPTSDKDVIITGNDGGSAINALTLDMSAAGAATFNSTIANKGAIFDYNTTMYQEDSAISSYAANNGLYVNGNSAGYLALRGDGSGKQNITLYGDTSGVDAIYMYTNAALTLRLAGNGDFYTTPRTGGHAVFNEDGVDADFRVESNLQSHMLSVDGGNDIVNFNSTQTTSQQGASHRADGFQREFQRDTNVFSISQGANSGTGARTRRVTINLHNYSPVKITIMNGGHYYNNGGAFGYRETTFHVAMETTTFRVNVKVDGVNSGTYASSYGVPTIAAAGSNPACQIDFTVAAGMTCSTYVKVEGYGANAVLGIADV